mmetsp:Transcript_9795/g.22343  ORF Transcript_9795/g.22343 Transcript_9795/m.22343 type:complete len:393 (-) Transcript_9795:2181-3359(-)
MHVEGEGNGTGGCKNSRQVFFPHNEREVLFAASLQLGDEGDVSVGGHVHEGEGKGRRRHVEHQDALSLVRRHLHFEQAAKGVDRRLRLSHDVGHRLAQDDLRGSSDRPDDDIAVARDPEGACDRRVGDVYSYARASVEEGRGVDLQHPVRRDSDDGADVVGRVREGGAGGQSVSKLLALRTDTEILLSQSLTLQQRYCSQLAAEMLVSAPEIDDNGRGRGCEGSEGEVGDQLEVQEADLDYRLPDGEVRELEAGNSFAAVHLQRHRGQKALVRIRRVRPEGFLLAAVEVSKLRGEGEEDEAGGGRQLRVGMGYAERWAGDRNHVDGNQLSVPDGVCQARVSDGDLQVSEPVLERRQAELEAAVGSVEEGGKGEERLISAHQLDVERQALAGC